MKLTPLKRKIVEALATAPKLCMDYHDLGRKLWPPEQHPKAWNYSSNGGPPGWAMPLGRALSELEKDNVVYERLVVGRRRVILLMRYANEPVDS